MLVIKVELHPADGGEIETLAEMQIVNDGTGSLGTGNYDVKAHEKSQNYRMYRGRVEGFPRAAGLSIFELVVRALKSFGCGA